MKFTVVTLFPDLVEGFLQQGLLSTARTKALVNIECINPRDFTTDVHGTVDDRAFGGGDGMVMKPEPLCEVVTALKASGPVKVVVLSPQGIKWTQEHARMWASGGEHVALICGRYAGIDQRFVSTFADEEISLGDFVLNGGEVAALAVMESVTRLLPQVLGNAVSAEVDSFAQGLLEAPQFTRPREWNGLPVPAPLLSGHHAEIDKFLHAVSVIQTALRRPDLSLESAHLDVVGSAAEVLKCSDLELKALGLSRGEVQELASKNRQFS